VYAGGPKVSQLLLRNWEIKTNPFKLVVNTPAALKISAKTSAATNTR
jgi:hypothetical protein